MRALALAELAREMAQQRSQQSAFSGGFIIVLVGTLPPLPQEFERAPVLVPGDLTLGELMRAAYHPLEEESYFFERMPEADVLKLDLGRRDFNPAISLPAVHDCIGGGECRFDWRDEQNHHGPPPKYLGRQRQWSKRVPHPRIGVRRG